MHFSEIKTKEQLANRNGTFKLLWSPLIPFGSECWQNKFLSILLIKKQETRSGPMYLCPAKHYFEGSNKYVNEGYC
jgi:hypothetical protein